MQELLKILAGARPPKADKSVTRANYLVQSTILRFLRVYYITLCNYLITNSFFLADQRRFIANFRRKDYGLSLITPSDLTNYKVFCVNQRLICENQREQFSCYLI
jgi:hypothetical protein